MRWAAAWQDALYGPHGFYRREAPISHFSTSSHGRLGAVLAEAVWRWADRVGATAVVDLGAGRGELLTHLHRARPDRPLLGCDTVERPEGLAPSVQWLSSPGGAYLPDALSDLTDVLVIANEWLDSVPCELAEVDSKGRLRVLLVEPTTGREQRGGPLEPADQQWCERYWPAAQPGQRVEVGRSRDRAWADLLSRITRGGAVAVDYGHRQPNRPRDGTFTAYRSGLQVTPVPDGSCDLTAHVAVDSLEYDELLTQSEAFAAVGMSAVPAAPELAWKDPTGYLTHLERTANLAELTRRAGLGAFWWVVAYRGDTAGSAKMASCP